ncbi:TerB family tellurite resistance protein [Dyadobacter sp. CY356]|uniref:TerB family tellurite resistance protein n=1 Tax=Dyadobacter sp. CY356 TaxID=2906442 RepID=UPI001F1FF238|nr:TerB family tellurite resistance protein [Dyadobacter sp. CY356]MCF0056043.1 TerB family tellurite resistance protein [Dyadobacter sp. CY356]
MQSVNLRPVSGIQSLFLNESSPNLREKHFVKELFSALPHEDLDLYAGFIGEIISRPVNEDYITGSERKTVQHVELNETTKQRFVNTMQRVTRLHEGISRRERSFIQQFWAQIRRL